MASPLPPCVPPTFWATHYSTLGRIDRLIAEHEHRVAAAKPGPGA